MAASIASRKLRSSKAQSEGVYSTKTGFICFLLKNGVRYSSALPSQSLKPTLKPLVPQAVGPAHLTRRRKAAALLEFNPIIFILIPFSMLSSSALNMETPWHSFVAAQTNFLPFVVSTKASQPPLISLREGAIIFPALASSIAFIAPTCLIAITLSSIYVTFRIKCSLKYYLHMSPLMQVL
ncbi:hypothetical protein SDC9_75771 [bioreactor metagenome]|uniref:Uncharacterized protein n=1 Tax=bioreactor metagenome TaxID=1076179 RepID=A0A644YMW9_9ZZZZ